MSGTLVELLIIVLLVLLNGVFVAAEIALITVRRSRLDQLTEEGNRGRRRVRRLVDDPGRFLAVIQLGVTFIGFLASAFAGVSLSLALEQFFRQLGLTGDFVGRSRSSSSRSCCSMFTIVFGELVPKTLALAHPERFALTLAAPVDLLGRILGPIVSFLTAVTARIARIFGADVTSEAQISAEELKLHRRARRGAGDPRGRGGADDQRGHRARRAPPPRGDDPADRDGRAAGLVDVRRRDRHGRRARATRGSRSTRNRSTRSSGILYAKDLLPFLKDSAGPAAGIRARCSGRRSSCPSR